MLEDISSENVAPTESNTNNESFKISKKTRVPVSAAALLCRAGSKLKNKGAKKCSALTKQTMKSESPSASTKREVKLGTEGGSKKDINTDKAKVNDQESNETKSMIDVPEEWIKPFKSGWRREIVYRGVQNPTKQTKQCDIYYFAPDKTKLRSLPMIMEYLTKTNSDLTKECFSFSKQKIYSEPQEIIRNAGEKGGMGKKLNEICVTKMKKDSMKQNVSLQGIENVNKSRGKSKKDKADIKDDNMKDDIKQNLSPSSPIDIDNEAVKSVSLNDKKKQKRKLDKIDVDESPSKKVALSHELMMITDVKEVIELEISKLPKINNSHSDKEKELIFSTKKKLKRKFQKEDNNAEEISTKKIALSNEMEENCIHMALNAKNEIGEGKIDPSDQKLSQEVESTSVEKVEKISNELDEHNNVNKRIIPVEDPACVGVNIDNKMNTFNESEYHGDISGSAIEAFSVPELNLKDEDIMNDSAVKSPKIDMPDNINDSAIVNDNNFEEKKNLLDTPQHLNIKCPTGSVIRGPCEVLAEQENSFVEEESQVTGVLEDLKTLTEYRIQGSASPLIHDDVKETDADENKCDEENGTIKQIKIMSSVCIHEVDLGDEADLTLSKEMVCQESIKSGDREASLCKKLNDEDFSLDTKSAKSLVDMHFFVVDLSILKKLDVSKQFYLYIENGIKRLIEPGSTSIKDDGLHISLSKPIPSELTKNVYINDTNVNIVVNMDGEKPTLIITA